MRNYEILSLHVKQSYSTQEIRSVPRDTRPPFLVLHVITKVVCFDLGFNRGGEWRLEELKLYIFECFVNFLGARQ